MIASNQGTSAIFGYLLGILTVIASNQGTSAIFGYLLGILTVIETVF